MLDQRSVMNKIEKQELKEIDGGLSISGTIINAFTNGMKTIFEVGRSLGNSMRRIKEGKMCEIS